MLISAYRRFVEAEGIFLCVDTTRAMGLKLLEGVGVGIFKRWGEVMGVFI